MVEADRSADPAPSGGRLLVVDDNEVLCRAIASQLSSEGYHVMTAYDGASAITSSEGNPPDVAVIDLHMPTPGLQVVRRLKEMCGPAIHAIVMTGNDDEGTRLSAFDAGANDYIVKPFGMPELKRRIDSGLRQLRAFVEVRLAKEAADRRMAYGVEATALLAHDLCNGLAVALSNVQYLHEDLRGLDDDQTDALAAAIRSLRRMSGLVANFVDISRFEDAAVKPIVSKVRIRQLLQSVLDVNAPSITRGVSFLVNCDDELEGKFDAALIERVLHNLVGNAARYCNAGGQITVAGRRWHDNGSTEISVTNTGPQITESIVNSLFGKYVRGGGGKRGMGLYFCRLVAEAHGGSISCEATPVGPSFVVRLPGRA
ncbi:MAG: response regulator [Kofleriaceae bacterium]